MTLKPAISSPSSSVSEIVTGPPSQLGSSRGSSSLPIGFEPVEVEVVRAAVALGVGLLRRVAEHRHAERGRDAAVVGVAVAEHDARDPAELRARDARRVRHRLHAGVEQHHAVAVVDEVDVHRLAREAAAHEPDAVGDLLGPARAELRRRPSSWR